jgi:hypothetical protein
VAGTLNGATGEQKLYINGVEVASQVTDRRPLAELDPNFGAGIGIGNTNSTYPEYLPGIIDEVRITSGALSPEQLLPPPAHEVVLRLWRVPRRWGSVELDPEPVQEDPPTYPAGTEVTLTAHPRERRAFKHWRIFDPNFPGDPNYSTLDPNLSITLTLDTDMSVVARFSCGADIGPMLPVILGLVGLSVWLRRRW